jgi:hypothetical protein
VTAAGALVRCTVVVGAILALLAAAPVSLAQEEERPERPLDSRLVERAATELAQFDVSIRGPAELIAALRPEDFKIRVGIHRLRSFRMDRLCRSIEAPAGGATSPEPEVGGPPRASGGVSPVVSPRPSFLLYFDQPLLTQAGRQRGLDLARELVPSLVAAGGRVTVVSNAGEVVTFVEDETDPEAIRAALDVLETDGRQWDPYASFESNRIDEVLRDLNDQGSIDLAIQTARRHQRYERWITEKSLRRLDQTLGRLALAPPPKAVVYFADTLRSNAGEHYLSFFSERSIANQSPLTGMQTDSLSASLPFDRVLHTSAALGIRFYTVHAQGLSLDGDRRRLSMSRLVEAGRLTYGSTIRIRDAQDSLGSLARETGGRVFLHAPRGSRIGEAIVEDLGCVFVFSFDPARFDRDQPLPLRIRVDVRDVDLSARGQILIQSPAARDRDRLLAAFVAPGLDEAAAFELRNGLVPLDFTDGRYRALLQVRVPAIPFSEAIWDLGASIVPGRSGEVAEVSARVTIPSPGSPAVFEREVRFDPGELRIVTVAHETASDRLASSRTPATWADPDARPATVGPVALLQPAAAVFVRDGDVRTEGSLALGPDERVEVGLPSALVSVVCRGPRLRRPIRVERELVGPAEVRFEPTDLEPDEHRCVQIRDVVPADVLAPGSFVYRVRASVAGREFDAGQRRFVAVDADRIAGPAPGDPP